LNESEKIQKRIKLNSQLWKEEEDEEKIQKKDKIEFSIMERGEGIYQYNEEGCTPMFVGT